MVVVERAYDRKVDLLMLDFKREPVMGIGKINFSQVPPDFCLQQCTWQLQ